MYEGFYIDWGLWDPRTDTDLPVIVYSEVFEDPSAKQH
jgi:hypothetical protein